MYLVAAADCPPRRRGISRLKIEDLNHVTEFRAKAAASDLLWAAVLPEIAGVAGQSLFIRVPFAREVMLSSGALIYENHWFEKVKPLPGQALSL